MLPIARREMFQAARWYGRRSVGLGDQLLDEIKSNLGQIVEFPGAAPIVDASFRRKLLNTFPYALIYRFDIDEIVVVAVANLKRRPGYWRRRVH